MIDARRSLAAALIAVALLLGGCGGSAAPTIYGGSAPPATAVANDVSVAQAAALREQGAFVLDVREPDEWAAGHIPGATLIPLGQVAGRATEVPRDRTVVVVCRSGNRSAQGRDILRQAGLTNVTSMTGGMNAWAAAGLPLVTGP